MLTTMHMILQLGEQLISDPVTSSPSKHLFISAMIKLAPLIGSTLQYFAGSDTTKVDKRKATGLADNLDQELVGWIDSLSEDENEELMEYISYSFERAKMRVQLPPERGVRATVNNIKGDYLDTRTLILDRSIGREPGPALSDRYTGHL